MAKAKTASVPYLCGECGWETAKWVGRCGECQAWGTVVERSAPKSRVQAGPVTLPALPIGEIPVEDSQARSSGVPELDRVLGGGLVPGAAILLAGEPGVGKSTLLLEVAAQTARYGHRTLYLTGEESAAQVRLRADRTGGIQDELYLAAETDLGAVLGHVEEVKPTLLVIDSIQTISAADLDGVPGGVTQVKEVAAALIRMAKLRNITLVLVGHVTKDGSIAGPRVLEHLVDVVLHFEGERSSRLRMVRAMKNRFGPIDEVGCFDLSSEGIVAITDPTGLFLDVRHGNVPGTCVAVAMEGRRPLLSEVQALVTHSASERPRRTTSGVDSSRVAMILAILQQHAGIRLHSFDVFVSSVGGARLNEPSNDLAIALAIASAFHGRPLGRQVVAVGELGLSGELRRVRDLDIRLSEAGRMGFRSAAVPAEAPEHIGRSRVMDGMRVVDIDNIRRALDILGMSADEAAAQG
ncbi:DNA repair protein RadA [Nocardioides marmoriginsengisoli]|uniref:DNA repair protein RadA n=1 Tax=Nocardioides marmoriginsengisoli TaxID=661483 RepID=A0A3N0CJY7_9ACTN|nr:DNA repair protein RadA [Nocardioides marmoriginsengisoli]RNL63336.1 DNA repair protein RadA [Nocardioides marmoriginsengisoli]